VGAGDAVGLRYARKLIYRPRLTRILRLSKQAGVFASRGCSCRSRILCRERLVLSARTSRKAIYALAFMAVAEIVAFARTTRTTFNFSDTQSPNLHAFIDKHPAIIEFFYQRTQYGMWLGKRCLGLLALHAQNATPNSWPSPRGNLPMA